MKPVSFIGLGTMGFAMAHNLLKRGYPLTVYNRTAEKAQDLAALGAVQASTPAEAARSADVVITMLGDDQSLRDVYYGPEGIIAGVRPGMTVIDSSTVSPEMSRQLHHDLLAHDVHFLDAPVTGSKPQAEEGTLVFMVGGSKEVLDEHRDLFEAMGRDVIHMGPPGSGSQAKLANNTITAINMLALSEGLAIAAKAGLDLDKFMRIVSSGGANSRMAEMKSSRILTGDFSVQFALGLMLKDLNLASDLASELELPAPMLEAARTIFHMARNKGLAHEDMSAVVKCYEEWSERPVRSNRTGDGERPPYMERRRSYRIPLNISLKLSVYQWEREGSFSGQNIDGTLVDLSETGLLVATSVPLARDMFIVIHFPKEANLPPITGKILRIDKKDGVFRYGCMLSGLPPYTRKHLESYIREQEEKSAESTVSSPSDPHTM